jgi:ATP-dependent helicase HepA
MSMQEFVVGQRWISAAELQLGLGMVIEIEHRTVSIVFPATGETRIYARADAPLTRVRFREGDWVEKQDGLILRVLELTEVNGLIAYQCEDEHGNRVELPEGRLSNFLQLNQPGERLLNAQIDRNKWFNLRSKTREIANRLQQSSVYGLAGSRTSLIAHQLYIAHEVSRRYAPRVLLADEVGLGKTIEAGLILHQLLLRCSASSMRQGSPIPSTMISRLTILKILSMASSWCFAAWNTWLNIHDRLHTHAAENGTCWSWMKRTIFYGHPKRRAPSTN